jgi:hypothetical protein
VEFTMMCPHDGPVDVGLEDVASVVVRGEDSLDVVFACPRCGADLRVLAQVPRMLMVMLEDAVVVDEETGERVVSVEGLAARGLLPPDMVAAHTQPRRRSDETSIERYCEYFRRQLASVDSVDAMLAEIDAR